MLRATALVLAIVLLGGCATDTAPIAVTTAIHQTSSLRGEGVIGSVFVGPFAWTYPIQWRGEGRMTLQYPAQPHIVLEGDLVWEPVYPEQLAGIQQQIALGNFRAPQPER